MVKTTLTWVLGAFAHRGARGETHRSGGRMDVPGSCEGSREVTKRRMYGLRRGSCPWPKTSQARPRQYGLRHGEAVTEDVAGRTSTV